MSGFAALSAVNPDKNGVAANAWAARGALLEDLRTAARLVAEAG